MSDWNESTIRRNLECIHERMAHAAERVGHHVNEITLVGVAKTFPAEAIRLAHAAGVRHFGENRVQEWEGKRAALGDLDATWHLVGHLQNNKAAKAARMFHAVDSVDDFALAQRLDRCMGDPARSGVNAAAGAAGGRRLRVLIEVRLAVEESKSGVQPEELPTLTEKVVELTHLDFAGLMCVPPLFEAAEKVRPFFARLRLLRDDLERQLGRKLPVLSMGMSQDFDVAIEEGATEIRVGTALFGGRGVK
ncbi:MAG: YggS family pyridoxal phosphate enzyme [Acidobacteria bacterium 13_1_40CM_2_60_7]|nr:MAG: YggS family pyridoxal phosphate enzyme [Acidobacteria bacterium 13_1_40CM_2_60_7]OLE83087.1 MAG: YggS family pyridoxal phosphate enzyme [Acidobacteria bacterium 13_1_20CM_2_60_10]PYU07402.1 MAG: YggS family pyridoxal phosphate-dependent enzyme [Acidobacteriota bacterium]